MQMSVEQTMNTKNGTLRNSAMASSISKDERFTGLSFAGGGVWGNATLASREKGEKIVAARVKQMVADIAALRKAPLPERVE